MSLNCLTSGTKKKEEKKQNSLTWSEFSVVTELLSYTDQLWFLWSCLSAASFVLPSRQRGARLQL